MAILATFAICLFLFAIQGIYRNWGRSTFDALPSNIDEPYEWIGKDHDKVWYTRWVKYVKGYFAFGPRSAYSWARWRAVPKILFAIKGKGAWRWEHDVADEVIDYEEGILRDKSLTRSSYYLSRVQYYCRWHFAIQWPLQVSFHYYWNKDVMPRSPIRTGDTTWRDMLFIYGPTHRDADRVYWILSFFIGGTWK